MCIVPPTLKELMKKKQALEMQKKDDFVNFRCTAGVRDIFK